MSIFLNLLSDSICSLRTSRHSDSPCHPSISLLTKSTQYLNTFSALIEELLCYGGNRPSLLLNSELNITHDEILSLTLRLPPIRLNVSSMFIQAMHSQTLSYQAITSCVKQYGNFIQRIDNVQDEEELLSRIRLVYNLLLDILKPILHHNSAFATSITYYSEVFELIPLGIHVLSTTRKKYPHVLPKADIEIIDLLLVSDWTPDLSYYILSSIFEIENVLKRKQLAMFQEKLIRFTVSSSYGDLLDYSSLFNMVLKTLHNRRDSSWGHILRLFYSHIPATARSAVDSQLIKLFNIHATSRQLIVSIIEDTSVFFNEYFSRSVLNDVGCTTKQYRRVSLNYVEFSDVPNTPLLTIYDSKLLFLLLLSHSRPEIFEDVHSSAEQPSTFSFLSNEYVQQLDLSIIHYVRAIFFSSVVLVRLSIIVTPSVTIDSIELKEPENTSSVKVNSSDIHDRIVKVFLFAITNGFDDPNHDISGQRWEFDEKCDLLLTVLRMLLEHPQIANDCIALIINEISLDCDCTCELVNIEKTYQNAKDNNMILRNINNDLPNNSCNVNFKNSISQFNYPILFNVSIKKLSNLFPDAQLSIIKLCMQQIVRLSEHIFELSSSQVPINSQESLTPRSLQTSVQESAMQAFYSVLISIQDAMEEYYILFQSLEADLACLIPCLLRMNTCCLNVESNNIKIKYQAERIESVLKAICSLCALNQFSSLFKILLDLFNDELISDCYCQVNMSIRCLCYMLSVFSSENQITIIDKLSSVFSLSLEHRSVLYSCLLQIFIDNPEKISYDAALVLQDYVNSNLSNYFIQSESKRSPLNSRIQSHTAFSTNILVAHWSRDVLRNCKDNSKLSTTSFQFVEDLVQLLPLEMALYNVTSPESYHDSISYLSQKLLECDSYDSKTRKYKVMPLHLKTIKFLIRAQSNRTTGYISTLFECLHQGLYLENDVIKSVTINHEIILCFQQILNYYSITWLSNRNVAISESDEQLSSWVHHSRIILLGVLDLVVDVASSSKLNANAPGEPNTGCSVSLTTWKSNVDSHSSLRRAIIHYYDSNVDPTSSRNSNDVNMLYSVLELCDESTEFLIRVVQENLIRLAHDRKSLNSKASQSPPRISVGSKIGLGVISKNCTVGILDIPVSILFGSLSSLCQQYSASMSSQFKEADEYTLLNLTTGSLLELLNLLYDKIELILSIYTTVAAVDRENYFVTIMSSSRIKGSRAKLASNSRTRNSGGGSSYSESDDDSDRFNVELSSQLYSPNTTDCNSIQIPSVVVAFVNLVKEFCSKYSISCERPDIPNLDKVQTDSHRWKTMDDIDTWTSSRLCLFNLRCDILEALAVAAENTNQTSKLLTISKASDGPNELQLIQLCLNLVDLLLFISEETYKTVKTGFTQRLMKVYIRVLNELYLTVMNIQDFKGVCDKRVSLHIKYASACNASDRVNQILSQASFFIRNALCEISDKTIQIRLQLLELLINFNRGDVNCLKTLLTLCIQTQLKPDPLNQVNQATVNAIVCYSYQNLTDLYRRCDQSNFSDLVPEKSQSKDVHYESIFKLNQLILSFFLPTFSQSFSSTALMSSISSSFECPYRLVPEKHASKLLSLLCKLIHRTTRDCSQLCLAVSNKLKSLRTQQHRPSQYIDTEDCFELKNTLFYESKVDNYNFNAYWSHYLVDFFIFNSPNDWVEIVQFVENIPSGRANVLKSRNETANRSFIKSNKANNATTILSLSQSVMQKFDELLRRLSQLVTLIETTKADFEDFNYDMVIQVPHVAASQSRGGASIDSLESLHQEASALLQSFKLSSIKFTTRSNTGASSKICSSRHGNGTRSSLPCSGGKRLRSRNQVIDNWLLEEVGIDTFADLEDFIV